MKICTCWVKYPNQNHRHKNGKWICVDNYTNIYSCDKGMNSKRKTRCVKKEGAE